MKNNQRHMEIVIGDAVLIKGDDKHSGKWNIGIIEELYKGKDNVIRTVKLPSRKTYIEWPIQFLYSLELSCDTWKRLKTVHQCSKQPLNVNVNEFKPRRNAAAIAKVQIREAAEANKHELSSSLFDPFCQIGGEWHKSCVINTHRNYCRWERETFSWSYK